LQRITTLCADPWFGEQMNRVRAGDEAALRRISESCLAHILAIAKRQWHPESPCALLDLIQEGNAALVQTIERFEGGTAGQFLSAVTTNVTLRIALIIEHPQLLDHST
jgi:DNA-directed RNA polymerase sigma subunit (sigma70/sigma32)